MVAMMVMMVVVMLMVMMVKVVMVMTMMMRLMRMGGGWSKDDNPWLGAGSARHPCKAFMQRFC